MSEFKVEVVQINKIGRVPNSDFLSITQINKGYPCIFRTGDFKEGDLAVYCPIDSIVPLDDPRFSFLAGDNEDKKTSRIKAVKKRGIFSMGLLVPAEPEWQIGQNVQELLKIEKWDPDIKIDMSGESERDTGILVPYTDIEGLRKYKGVLQEGELVVCTEKLHGAQSKYLHDSTRLFIGSHHRVKRLDGNSIWNRAATNLNLSEKLQKYPDHVFYGEVYGQVQKGFEYDIPQGDVGLRVFDIYSRQKGMYLNWDEVVTICQELELPMVPELYRGPWSLDLMELAEGQTTLGKHIREGYVVKPLRERWEHSCGRVIFKLISEKYLLKKG